MMGAVAYLTQVCEDVTLWAYRSAGSQGLRNPSLVQRCFRDMLTGGLHVFVDRESFEEHARNQLGLNGQVEALRRERSGHTEMSGNPRRSDGRSRGDSSAVTRAPW